VKATNQNVSEAKPSEVIIPKVKEQSSPTQTKSAGNLPDKDSKQFMEMRKIIETNNLNQLDMDTQKVYLDLLNKIHQQCKLNMKISTKTYEAQMKQFDILGNNFRSFMNFCAK